MSADHSLLNRARASGVLLHPTSLPGPEGIGTLGPETGRFLDFLAASGQSIWQMLPVGPTGYGDSPYQCFSAFAGNPLLISTELLVRDNLLQQEDLADQPAAEVSLVDFRAVIPWKQTKLHRAFDSFQRGSRPSQLRAFDEFRRDESWLHEYALFMTLKQLHDNSSWLDWDAGLRLRDPAEIERVCRDNERTIEFHEFVQFLFNRQWSDLHETARSRGVSLIGDMPIFVSLDSADVWANRDSFQLDPTGRPTVVSGVPPDYYSETGQLWGNPIYDWDRHQQDNYAWWASVFRSRFALFDMVRVDHFRGFAAYWAVPFGNRTAEHGEWVPGPGATLFQSLERQLGTLPIIAEDLGVITPDVVALKERFRFPGMKILQFGFDARERNNHLPHTYTQNSVVYTGSHDNNTTRGWFDSASEADRAHALSYLSGDDTAAHDRRDSDDGRLVNWEFIRAALMSVSRYAVIPMQDLLGLGSEARMNTPGTLGGNWAWRMGPEYDDPELAERFNALTRLYSRLP